VWWRFRRHHLAMASAGLLILLYLIVLFPSFFSTQDPERTDARQAFIPVQSVHLFTDGKWAPWVPAIVGKRNPTTLRMEWTTDTKKKVPVHFLGAGPQWRVFGLIPTHVHLIVPADPNQRIFLLGSDRLGRDQWSRIMHGTQTSMTVGLVAVALSVILGVVLGGISGYVGGKTDQVIQRVIELPTFVSHIIATSSLAIPVMIINETSLSFLGLGIRPPAISWGVLLQEAQNIQTLALAPWLLIPGLVVIVSVLAFNLVGDGLRDAADPYSH
jgi:ABC-type dipeptide/oligopeptide/nickel transport system permease subunit